ncbi:MAG: alkaline phosphatase family protein [Phycisphaerales bacterium]|nr:alkaline phosphatase family protein [Phycisphaerales bacterium]
MNRVAVLNVVALSPNLIGEHTPAIKALADRSGGVHTMSTTLPAVTTTVQASMLTGAPASEHGIVGNGWYDRTEGQVKFWKQSNKLVQADPVWRTARERDPDFTCANICWWYAMNSDVDTWVTPRPIYRANGRKVPDCLTRPGSLRDRLQARHGTFPLFRFWGPGANIESTRWITNAALDVEETCKPTLQLVYLPHLDYCLQKLGPGHPEIPNHLREVDAEVARLVERFDREGVRVILVSEYGIEPVTRGVALNRILREHGHLELREELGREMLVPDECRALAIADHQIAHVYVRCDSEIESIRALLEGVDGVERVLGRDELEEAGLAHERSGDLVAVSTADAWFTYDWWLDERRAPDYARTVDIHAKPGYDPRELFMSSRLRAAWKLFLMKMGIRTLLDVIPLDDRLVRGSHGRTTPAPGHEAVLIANGASDQQTPIPCTMVRDLILQSIFD